MLEQQQHIADAAGTPLVDERPLQVERLRVRDAPEPPDFQVLHNAAGSNVSICVLTMARNWSATAPSTTRWS